MKWINSVKEAIGMSQQELSRAVEDRTLWTSPIQARSWRQLNGMWHTHKCDLLNSLVLKIPVLWNKLKWKLSIGKQLFKWIIPSRRRVGLGITPKPVISITITLSPNNTRHGLTSKFVFFFNLEILLFFWEETLYFIFSKTGLQTLALW